MAIAAQAQNNTREVKVETIEMTIVTTTAIETKNEAKTETTTEVARLYKFKKSRIKKTNNEFILFDDKKK